MTNTLQTINKAKLALAEARDIYEVLDIRDKAMVASAYADAKGASEVANIAKEVQLRAERKAGEFLRSVPRNPGARTDLTSVHNEPRLQDVVDDVGVSMPTAKRWQKSADVPEEQFEEYIIKTLSSGDELTSAGVQRLFKECTRCQ